MPFHVHSLAPCLPAFQCLCSIDWVGGRTAFPDWTLGTIGQFYGNGKSALPLTVQRLCRLEGCGFMLWVDC